MTPRPPLAHPTLPDAAWRQPVVRAWLAALALTLLWDASGLDRAVMHLIGGPEGFAWRELPLLSHWLHDRWRSAATAALVGLWAWALWPGDRHGLPRRERVAVALLAVGALVAVNLVKNRSATSCPWDWQDFGGPAAVVSHWRWGVTDGGPGRCFPGGHASSALAFVALALPWLWPPAGAARRTAVGVRWLVAIVLAGAVAGGVQTLRGAHPPSHTLWTLLISGAVALGGWAALRPWLARSPAQAESQRQVDGHAADDGAQHPALPHEPGHASGGGKEPRVLPGGDQVSLTDDDLGNHDRGQRSNRGVLQATLRPVRQRPGFAAEEEKTARDDGDRAEQHEGQQRPGVEVKHGGPPRWAGASGR